MLLVPMDALIALMGVGLTLVGVKDGDPIVTTCGLAQLVALVWIWGM